MDPSTFLGSVWGYEFGGEVPSQTMSGSILNYVVSEAMGIS